jgi:hypothetical protein
MVCVLKFQKIFSMVKFDDMLTGWKDWKYILKVKFDGVKSLMFRVVLDTDNENSLLDTIPKGMTTELFSK